MIKLSIRIGAGQLHFSRSGSFVSIFKSLNDYGNILTMDSRRLDFPKSTVIYPHRKRADITISILPGYGFTRPTGLLFL
jgi:hypothetical protein